MRAKKFVRSLRCSLVFSVISSLAVLGSMIDVGKEREQIVIMSVSSLFWLGTVLEQIFIWRANGLRKKIEANSPRRKAKGLPGICSFAKTVPGLTADAVFVLSLIAFIILSIIGKGADIIQYILLFLIVLSFRVHCTANGKNYRYKLLLQKEER